MCSAGLENRFALQKFEPQLNVKLAKILFQDLRESRGRVPVHSEDLPNLLALTLSSVLIIAPPRPDSIKSVFNKLKLDVIPTSNANLYAATRLLLSPSQ